MKKTFEHIGDNTAEIPPQREAIKYAFETGNAVEGFNAFNEFVKQLREKNPELSYPSDAIIDRISPDNYARLVTYIMKDHDETVGGIIGNAEADHFEAFWFMVAPEYQNTEIGKLLLKSMFGDFDKIEMVASVKDIPQAVDRNRQVSRQKALVRYYEQLGFHPNTEAESYQYSDMPGAPMPMVWERDK